MKTERALALGLLVWASPRAILGLKWHADGMKLKKKNTFNDFIDVAEYLIAQKYTHPKRLFATGRSAGGLLMGAVANMRPDLFKGIIAEVPLVALLPPPQDREDYKYESEFGYPSIKEQYFYLLSYSPYDNVERTPLIRPEMTGNNEDTALTTEDL